MADVWLVVLERLPVAVAGNLAFAALAVGLRAVDPVGACVGLVLGVAITLGLGPGGLWLVILFVGLGSAFTRLKYAEKQRRGAAQDHGGRRGWRNAVANLGAAAAASLAALGGHPLWVVAAVGAAAAALADTTESELGLIVGRRAYLPPRLTSVPPGTEGAVSVAGTLLGALAATALASTAAGLGLIGWSLVPACALGALLATLLESLLGAGRELDNDLLNTVTTTAGALLAVVLAAATAR